MSELTLHNRDVRDEYYKNFTGGIPRCDNAVTENWLLNFQNALYHKTPEERQNALTQRVNLAMADVVDHIFEHRRIFRNGDISLTRFEICRWMKEKAPHSYNEMKKFIRNFLITAADSGEYTEKKVKDGIAFYFAFFLENNFIWL